MFIHVSKDFLKYNFEKSYQKKKENDNNKNEIIKVYSG